MQNSTEVGLSWVRGAGGGSRDESALSIVFWEFAKCLLGVERLSEGDSEAFVVMKMTREMKINRVSMRTHDTSSSKQGPALTI
ncbi:Uncharacterized protein HZ326_11472 [Fusarium oxysporum f. sp. albedinis]|nr:Uncharacterized protein HZ326_11472 [Fusarium oxysporum f. sp. albedinis]